MDTGQDTSAGLAFGRFLLLPHRRELLADGELLKLGGRALDVLMALIDARETVLSKDALMARVWPGRIVEENALQTQISALRAALGADRDLIRTVSGRGYQFTGEVRPLSAKPAERDGPRMAEPRATPVPTNLPEPVSELIGREDVLAEILSLADERRLVTLTGAGGIGKTRLALAAARRRLPQFADGVRLVEFSPLADPDLVPATVAAAVGVELGPVEPSAQRLAQRLADRRLLLVLDTCEHVIGAVALLVEAILRASTTVRLLATSREPLEVEGEWVYSVPPLAVPAEDAEADEVQCSGAVRLFVERAGAANPRFVPDGRLSRIAAICRRLDGMPLAIEMAAARASVLPIEEIAARLDDRFQLLTARRRTALPRHQTLRATFDWSYELLGESERVVLRRLAIFAGDFSLEAAGAVATGPQLGGNQVIECLAVLVAKSLVVAQIGGPFPRYRLLDTTRAYALEKLDESGERGRLARRHAEFCRDRFERAEADWEAQTDPDWFMEYAREIDDLRVAIDWAFSVDGDPSIGIALTAAAVPLWLHLSLMEECRGWVERALAALRSGAGPDPRREMKLYAALGRSAIYTGGAGVSEVGASWAAALELAERLGDTEYQLRALRGLWYVYALVGRYAAALPAAERFAALTATRPDPNERLIAESMVGAARHFLGDHAEARRHLEHVLANYVAPSHRGHFIRFEHDRRVTARGLLARILWLQGFPDQAVHASQAALVEASATGHIISACYALARSACPIALWVGDLAAAERHITKLLDLSEKHAIALGTIFGRAFHTVLSIKRGQLHGGSRSLLDGIDDFRRTRGEGPSQFAFMMAEALGVAGQIDEGLAIVEEAIAHSAENDDRWQIAELLRVRGELSLLQDGAAAAGAAETDFRQALDWARRQGALSWELRAATSLARLLRDKVRPGDAVAILQPVYERYTEGFETADVAAAKRLIGSLGKHSRKGDSALEHVVDS
jgi:predicted ATPase/DNA-binding winged helix-turn-helix (wHTH) protein